MEDKFRADDLTDTEAMIILIFAHKSATIIPEMAANRIRRSLNSIGGLANMLGIDLEELLDEGCGDPDCPNCNPQGTTPAPDFPSDPRKIN